MSAAWSQIGPKPAPMPAGELDVIATEYVEAGRLDAAFRLLGHILAAPPATPKRCISRASSPFVRQGCRKPPN
jgi:hypothetical protein